MRDIYLDSVGQIQPKLYSDILKKLNLMHRYLEKSNIMNFHKLSYNQIVEFLALNNANPAMDIYKQAANLFNELKGMNGNTFTISLVDLYIATQLQNVIDPTQIYTRESILNADPTTILQFATIMGLPMDNNVRERIIRILDFMELIYPLTIGEVITKVETSVFYYEISTNESVSVDSTIDSLYRHVIEEFNIHKCDTGSYEIHKEGNKQYLSLELKYNDESSPEYEYWEFPATKENMMTAFNYDAVSETNSVSSNGKLIVPSEFSDYVYIEIDGGYDERSDIIFIFNRIEPFDKRIIDYIEFVPPKSNRSLY
jgi:hypothetical protein